jgi:hypothetical protein
MLQSNFSIRPAEGSKPDDGIAGLAWLAQFYSAADLLAFWSSPTFEGSRRRFAYTRHFKQFFNIGRKRFSKPLQNRNSRIFEPTLKPADIGSVDFSIHGKNLLREPVCDS